MPGVLPLRAAAKFGQPGRLSARVVNVRRFAPTTDIWLRRNGRLLLAIDRETYVRGHPPSASVDVRLTELNLNQFRMIVTVTRGQLLRSRKQCNA